MGSRQAAEKDCAVRRLEETAEGGRQSMVCRWQQPSSQPRHRNSLAHSEPAASAGSGSGHGIHSIDVTVSVQRSSHTTRCCRRAITSVE